MFFYILFSLLEKKMNEKTIFWAEELERYLVEIHGNGCKLSGGPNGVFVFCPPENQPFQAWIEQKMAPPVFFIMCFSPWIKKPTMKKYKGGKGGRCGGSLFFPFRKKYERPTAPQTTRPQKERGPI